MLYKPGLLRDKRGWRASIGRWSSSAVSFRTGRLPGSDPDRSAREQSLDLKERQLQREAEDFKNDSEGASQTVFQTIAQKVYAFVQTYAQNHGYALVLERGSDTAPVVWYAAKDVDITDQVVKAYNQTVASSPAQGSSAPASTLPSSPSPH